MRILFKNGSLIPGQEKVEAVGEHSLAVSVPEGIWRVRVSAGDLEDEGDVNVHVRLNGSDMPPIWVNDRAISRKEYETGTADGKIFMEFSGPYVCIQGIELAKKIEAVPVMLGNEVQFHPDIRGWENELRWSKKNGSVYENVHIYRYDREGDRDPEVTETENTGFYIDDDVRLCGSYEYKICYVDELGFEGPWSEMRICEIADESYRKAQIRELCICGETENAISLNWQIDGEAVCCRVWRRSAWGNRKLVATVPVGGPSVTWTDECVYTDRPYTYYVEAESFGGLAPGKTVTSIVAAAPRRRQMEALDRGLVAIKTGDGVFLSWRIMPRELEEGIGFLLYLNGSPCFTEPYYGASNYFLEGGRIRELLGREGDEMSFSITAVDRNGAVLTPEDYDISEMGMYLDRGCVAVPWEKNYLELPLNKPEPYRTPDGRTYEYTANDASAADLDGDGEYEILLKWDCNGKDNSHKGYSGICLIDAYKLDGTMLWRISLGPNIRCGAHYTQFLAYDFDGDGYAELVMKTADGTVDGTGRVIGDPAADYRNSDGFILEGPEFLTLFDGRTGAALDTVPYVPGRGNVAEYGDSWGNRVDRFLACVAYLDGVHPSAVMCRGYYDHGRPTNLVAWDIQNKRLVMRWKFRADAEQNIHYTNQGFHNLAVADVDGDGCDEIIYGACVIDEDGTGLYSTGLEHGDAMHVGRFTAHSEGYDYYGIHEHAECPYGMEARDAGTGRVRWGKYTGRDTGRGLVAKIDPRRPGCQMWALPGDGLFDYEDGAEVSEVSPSAVNFAIWWDGDLLRELFDHEWHGYESNISIPRVYKWDWEKEELQTLLSADECAANNGSKGNPCLQASLFGDWREELVLRTKDSTALHIYSTVCLTAHRFYTFMADETYRLGIAWQNTAYNQPPQTSFYIGDDMKDIPIPRHRYITV